MFLHDGDEDRELLKVELLHPHCRILGNKSKRGDDLYNACELGLGGLAGFCGSGRRSYTYLGEERDTFKTLSLEDRHDSLHDIVVVGTQRRVF